MAWFKVDDGLHSSRKLMSIPKRARFAAIGLWTVAGSWAADELTDGHVPEYMVSSWGAPPSAPAALVGAGLWEHVSGGYLFCNWHEYQPSKQDVDAERAASRERMRELRARRKQGKPRKDAEEPEVFGRTVPNGSQSVRNPDPTRPDPSISNEIDERPPRKRGTRLDPQWTPDRDLIVQMEIECPGVDLRNEHRVFVDYWVAQPGQKGVKTDWPATWRNWMRRKHGDIGRRKLTPTERAQQTAAAGRNVAGQQITTLEPKGIEA